MKKTLSEYSLQELWQLFPINLEKYKDIYECYYNEECDHLNSILGKDIVRINHIGSTAVKGLIAKPIIDILLEIKEDSNMNKVTTFLLENGWVLMSKNTAPDLKISFNKGYTEKGFLDKVYHLHVRYFGDCDELYFRDYLIEHKNIADKYAKLKLSLIKKYKYDRDAYTQAKSDFIKKYSLEAKDKYKNKYKVL